MSVRRTFDMIAEIACDDVHAYHYEMANSVASLDEAIPRIARDRKSRYLYLATHGDSEGLHLFNDEVVPIPHLARLLSSLPPGSRFHGLYLAACSVGSEPVANELFNGGAKLAWIAGYQAAVDWLPSSSLDILFFEELLSVSDLSEIEGIKAVAKRLRELAPGLIEELGFGIFVKSRGKAIDLLDGLHNPMRP